MEQPEIKLSVEKELSYESFSREIENASREQAISLCKKFFYLYLAQQQTLNDNSFKL